MSEHRRETCQEEKLKSRMTKISRRNGTNDFRALHCKEFKQKCKSCKDVKVKADAENKFSIRSEKETWKEVKLICKRMPMDS